MMKKRFKYSMVAEGAVHHYYNSDKVEFYKSGPVLYYATSFIHNGNNGTKTCYAGIRMWHECFSHTNKIGFYITRHFQGRNTYQQAEAWCNYLLNNPPYYAYVLED